MLVLCCKMNKAERACRSKASSLVTDFQNVKWQNQEKISERAHAGRIRWNEQRSAGRGEARNGRFSRSHYDRARKQREGRPRVPLFAQGLPRLSRCEDALTLSHCRKPFCSIPDNNKLENRGNKKVVSWIPRQHKRIWKIPLKLHNKMPRFHYVECSKHFN